MILSNYSEPEMVERGRRLGVLEYIVKADTTPGEVARKVDELRDSLSR